MKLIYCPNCGDIVALKKRHRQCYCGASGGYYVDFINAKIEGEAIPIGIEIFSFIKALANQPKEGDGKEFTAFVIPKNCDHVERVLSGLSPIYGRENR